MRPALIGTLAALAVLAGAAPALAASITESECFQAPGTGRGCAAGTGLQGAAAVAVSPDGRSVYVGGNVEERGTLLVFTRDPATGRLTQTACFAERTRGGCTANEALFGVNDVVVARDGRTVYALGILPGSVGVFRRDAEGALTPIQCVQAGYSDLVGCPRVRFETPWKFALTPDGRELLVLGSQVTRFDVGADGRLSDPVNQRVPGLRNAQAIAVGDNRTVYAASGTDDRGRLSVLDRNPATGALSLRACSADLRSGTGCRTASGVDGPADLAVSVDRRAVYLAASSFRSRNPDNPFALDGSIQSSALSVFAPRRGAQTACLLYTGRRAARGSCQGAPTARGPGFFGASAIAVTPNGKAAVAGFAKSSAVALLLRNPRTQRLGPARGRGGCVRDASRRRMVPRGCAAGRGIYQPSDIAVSPDSRNAYVATPGGLVVFRLAYD